MTTVCIQTIIDAPIERCFDLARDVGAHTKSAAFSRERLVQPGRMNGLLELGDLVTFEGRHFGLRQRFTAKITELERPHRFVDEMARGTFKSLRHVHEFEVHNGQTVMRDVLTWEAPLGVIGRFADALFLKRHMVWFVTTKQRHLKLLAEQTAA